MDLNVDANVKRAILDSVLIGAACLGFCRWNSPNWLRRAAVRMMARAEGLEAKQKAHEEGLAHWQKRLEVNDSFN